MKKLVVVAVVLIVAALGIWFEPTGIARGYLRGEKRFDGRPSSAWASRLTSTDAAEQSQTLALLEGANDAAVPMLCELLDRPEEEVRWKSAELIGKLAGGDADAARALEKLLGDADRHVREVAIRSLGVMGTKNPTATAILGNALAGNQGLAAAKALQQVGPAAKTAVSQLVPLLKSPSADIRWQAAKTLGSIGPEAAPAVDALIASLTDAEWKVRERSADTLGLIGPAAARAVPYLIKTAQDENQSVRRDSLRSLGQIGAAAAISIPIIEAALNDPNPRTREIAKTALANIRK